MNALTLDIFPHRVSGVITGYTDEGRVPSKIIEMGLLPHTQFKIMHQAPFGGPLYIEFGAEKSRIALRAQEARFLKCEETGHYEYATKGSESSARGLFNLVIDNALILLK